MTIIAIHLLWLLLLWAGFKIGAPFAKGFAEGWSEAREARRRRS